MGLFISAGTMTRPIAPHSTTKRTKLVKPSYRKGVRGKRATLAKEVAREVCGFAPYEKRAIELLRNGLDKRALRICKRKLGTHTRGKSKVEDLGRFARQ